MMHSPSIFRHLVSGTVDLFATAFLATTFFAGFLVAFFADFLADFFFAFLAK
jgi:hypothetical protein